VIVGLLVVGGYLFGSVPFGLLVGRMGGVDVRTQGSGNIGATNVGRLLGRPYGMLVFALDVLKGLAPMLLAGWALADLWAETQQAQAARYLCWLGVGAASVIGHNYPVYLGFRGGKGVSTSLGVTLGVYPDLTVPALVALMVWVIVVAVSRYVSLGSVCAGIALPVVFAALSSYRGVSLLSERWPLTVFALLMTTLVLIRHRSNLGRLLAGTEAKIGSRAKEPPGSATS
jgi:glycerol-3-phosphate acyltransferase PlsY